MFFGSVLKPTADIILPKYDISLSNKQHFDALTFTPYFFSLFKANWRCSNALRRLLGISRIHQDMVLQIYPCKPQNNVSLIFENMMGNSSSQVESWPIYKNRMDWWMFVRSACCIKGKVLASFALIKKTEKLVSPQVFNDVLYPG